MSGEDLVGPGAWQTRMGMMNGSMPSLFATANGRSTTPMNGSSSGSRGRPPDLSLSGAADRRSGSMPRTNGHAGTGGNRGGGSGSSSPRGPLEPASRSTSRPKLKSPNSGSSVGHQSQHLRRGSDDDFQPPQAPFAREAFLKNNPSRSRQSSSFSNDERRASPLPGSRPSPTSPDTPNSVRSVRSVQPSITVTEHGKLSGDRSSGSMSGTVSLNDTKEKRPQSELLNTTNASTKSGKEKGGGGFLSSTFRRLSMKP